MGRNRQRRRDSGTAMSPRAPDIALPSRTFQSQTKCYLKGSSLRLAFLLLVLGTFAILVVWSTAGYSATSPSAIGEHNNPYFPLKDPAMPMMYDYEIINTYDHDSEAYTQGLLYEANNMLLESTGHYGRSSVRRVNLTTGKPAVMQRISEKHFAEGLHVQNGKIYLLTWKSPLGLTFDAESLREVGNFSTNLFDGWGLTGNGTHIVATDSGSSLLYLNPGTLNFEKAVPVTFQGKSVKWLNELEFIHGEIWANIYMRECIARINPDTGIVRGWVFMRGLRQLVLQEPKYGRSSVDVLNGIAWDNTGNRLFVTGKNWPKLFEIRVKQIGPMKDKDKTSVMSTCLPPDNWNV